MVLFSRNRNYWRIWLIGHSEIIRDKKSGESLQYGFIEVSLHL